MKRRDFLLTGSSVFAALGMPAQPAGAAGSGVQALVRQVAGASPVTPGRVRLVVPPLVDNGNAVPLAVSVDSPMTAADHVRAIHVFAEKNPQPTVAVFRFGPRAGRASINTRIRLADSQTLMAVAEMSDGTFWSATADTVVTIAACTEVL